MSEPKESNTVFFRVGDPSLRAALEARTEAGMGEGLVARRDLEFFYQLLADELRGLELTEGEAMLVTDALSGLLTEPHTYRLTWAGIEDAIALERLDRKWGVDGKALVAKLRALCPGATMALVDAVRRAWRLVGSGDARPMQEILAEVGLLRGGKANHCGS